MTKEDLEDKLHADTEEEDAETKSEEEADVETETAEDEAVELSAEEQLEILNDKLAEAETSLAAAEKTAAEYLDGWKRAQASFANFRKRTEAEQAQWRSKANAQLLSRLLPVLDDFKRAFDAIPDDDKNDSWLSGIQLVQKKVLSILESENVQPIQMEVGNMFDPNVHEAVLYQEVEGFEEGQVVAEIETGYMLGDHVLRPTLVVVAKGTPETEAVAEGQPATPNSQEEATESQESAEDAA